LVAHGADPFYQAFDGVKINPLKQVSTEDI
jgi:hypothetical protein